MSVSDPSALPQSAAPIPGTLETDMMAGLAGDTAAYERVLRALMRPLQAYIGRSLQPKDRDDVVQDILLSLHRARHTWDAGRPLMPWVMAIARYRLQDHWRRHYGHGLEGMADLDALENILASDTTKSLETSEDIRRIMAGLPAQQRQILDLMYRQDKSVQEVAAAMNLTVSAVKTAAHRAYKIFRKQLKE